MPRNSTDNVRTPWAIALAIALPLLYPASEGPAVFALARGWISYEWCEFVYGPLWRATVGTPFDPACEAYTGIWLWLAEGRWLSF